MKTLIFKPLLGFSFLFSLFFISSCFEQCNEADLGETDAALRCPGLQAESIGPDTTLIVSLFDSTSLDSFVETIFDTTITIRDTLFIENDTIIRLDTILEPRLIGTSRFVQELKTYLELPVNKAIEEINVIDTCNCDLILIDLQLQDVDLNSSVTQSKSKAEKQDDGTDGIAAVDYNFNIKMPLNELDSLNPIKLPAYYQDGVKLRPSSGNIDTSNDDDNAINVAVIDTGIDPFHEIFTTKRVFPSDDNIVGSILWLNREESINPSSISELDKDGVDNDGNCLVDDLIGYNYFNTFYPKSLKLDQTRLAFLPIDDDGHGTHISGTIATAADFNKINDARNIRIMNLKFAGYSDAETPRDSFEANLFSALCALDYAIENNAKIINMSWGYYADEPNFQLVELCERAAKNDITMVASAGNDMINIDLCSHWPSNLRDSFPQNMISVGALGSLRDINGDLIDEDEATIAPFSNFGKVVDILVPGTGINSADNRMDFDDISTAMVCLNGTSMAAAIISRRAAIIRVEETSLDAGQVKSKIIGIDEAISIPAFFTKVNQGTVMKYKLDTDFQEFIDACK